MYKPTNRKVDPFKILFYLDPWIEKGNPQWKNAWAPLYLEYITALRERAKGPFEFFVITGNAQLTYFESQFDHEDIFVSVVEQSELLDIFPGPREAQESWYGDKYSKSQLSKMQDLIGSKIGDFVPDVIWSFVSAVPFLKKMFPQALTLNQELGMLGRAPLPITWYLDADGTFSNSFLVKNSKELKELSISRKEQLFVDEVRFLYRSAIRAGQKFTRSNLDPKNQYRKLVLLPLQYNGHFVFDSMCEYQHQFDFLFDCMSRIPSDIGVVVTEHKNPVAEPVLNEGVISYMKTNFPNFIYSENLDSYTNSSLMVLELVDGVVSVSSTLGLQAMFLGKALFSVWESQLTPYSNVSKLEDIGDYFERENELYEDRDALIYYLLTRYYIPHKHYMLDGEWLKVFLSRMMVKREEGVGGLDLYDPIDSDRALLDFYKLNSQKKIFANRLRFFDETKDQDSGGDAALSKKNQTQLKRLAVKNSELKEVISAFENSTSWRVTAPLRKLKRVMGK